MIKYLEDTSISRVSTSEVTTLCIDDHSILASLERILHEISNDKSNTQNGDSEDYQKKTFQS